MRSKVAGQGGGKDAALKRSRHFAQRHLGRGLAMPPDVAAKESFRTRFPLSKPGADRVEKARGRREFAVYPYSNPKPFDHRGVNWEAGWMGRDYVILSLS